MTYEELFNTAMCEMAIPMNEVVKYKPASPIFIPELKYTIQNAIVIWLESGSTIIYIGK